MSYMAEESLRMPAEPERPHIPASLNYKMKAHSLIKQKLREVRIPPQNGGSFVGAYSQISFVINDKNFILPDMALDCTLTANTVGVADTSAECQNTFDRMIRLDQSGHSIINRLEVFMNGVPVEKIEEYGSLMAMISDIHIPRGKRKCLQATQQYASCDDVDLPFNSNVAKTGEITITTAIETPPAISHYISTPPGVGVTTSRLATLSGANDGVCTSGELKGESLYGVAGINTTQAEEENDIIAGACSASKQYCDASVINPPYNQRIYAAAVKNAPTRIGGRGGLTDGCDEVILCSQAFANINAAGQGMMPYIKNGVDYGVVTNAGTVAATEVRQSVRMTIPLSLSSICGVLAVDQKAWPGFAFCPIEIRITLDPYAVVAMSKTGHRSYKIEPDCQLIYKSIETDEMFMSDLQAFTMKNGLSVHCLQYNTTLYQPPKGSTNVNFTITKYYQSLRSILFGFFPQGYNANPTQRKFSRVSNCLSELQLQCGSSFFPCQPIRGNSGNSHVTNSDDGHESHSVANSSASTIAPFLHQLYSSYSNFASLSLDGIMTPANCCYNGLTKGGYTFGSSPYHCGRMCYAIDTSTTTDNPTISSDNTICGLDTTNGNNPVVLRYVSSAPAASDGAAAHMELELRLYQLYDIVVYCNPMKQIGVNL